MTETSSVPTKRVASWPPRTIFIIPFLADVAGMLLIFGVGRILAEDGAGILVLGLVGGGHALSLALSSVVAGPLSDRLGRGRVIVPGMVLFVAASVVCAATPTGGWISLSMYWLSALSLGMIHPATIAWVNTASPSSRAGRSRGVSGNLVRFCVSWNVGVLVAQAAGGSLLLRDPRLPFMAAGAVMAVNIFVAMYVSRAMSTGIVGSGARTTRDADAAADIGSESEETIRPAESGLFVRLAWLANLGGAVAVSMLLHLFPQLAVGLGIPADRHGVILASMRIIAIGMYLLLHRTRFWHYRFSVNLIVQIVCSLGLLIIFFAQESGMLILGVCLVAVLVGFNYFSGIYYGSAGHDESKRGFASGMHEATLGIGIAIGSAAGGFVGRIATDRAPYLLGAIVVVILIFVQVGYYVRQKKSRLTI